MGEHISDPDHPITRPLRPRPFRAPLPLPAVSIHTRPAALPAEFEVAKRESSPSEPSLVGALLGHYHLVRLLGQGGMGSVYEAIHVHVGYRVAIKILHPRVAERPEDKARFLREARAARHIHHPGIVEIYDAGIAPVLDRQMGERKEGERVYLVMEFLSGQSLEARLKLRGPLGGGELWILEQLAKAVAAAHKGGVVHRDIKPENVMLVPDPEHPGAQRVKLLDFGIARLPLEPGAQRLTHGDLVMGTPQYMSPEQCRGSRYVETRSDVYSLGILAYQALSGRLPFLGENSQDVMRKHCEQAPPPLADLAPLMPKEVISLVEEMLAKDPSRRPSASEVAARLESLLLHRESGAAADLSRRRSPLVRGAFFVGILALLLAFGMTLGFGGRRLFSLQEQDSLEIAADLTGYWILALTDKNTGGRSYGVFALRKQAHEQGGLRGAEIAGGEIIQAGETPWNASSVRQFRGKVSLVSKQTLYVVYEWQGGEGLLDLTLVGQGALRGNFQDRGTVGQKGTVYAERVLADTKDQALLVAFERFGQQVR